MIRKMTRLALLVWLVAGATPAAAAPILINGGFEAGFAGWTRADQVGSDGAFLLQTGTASPVNALPVPAPPEGLWAVMTDAQGPGAHVLYQDFLVPSGGPATLTFSWFVQTDVAFVTPDTLAFDTPALNQQARVDILRGGTDPFSLAAGDLLLNVFLTNVGDPQTPGYSVSTTDLTALLAAHTGETLRLRFAETDNVSIFNFGVDDVRLGEPDVQVPEPAALLLVGIGTALAAARRRTR